MWIFSPEFKTITSSHRRERLKQGCTYCSRGRPSPSPLSNGHMRIIGLAAMSLVGLAGVPGRDESQPRTPLLRPWEGDSCWNASFSPGAAACLFGAVNVGTRVPGLRGWGWARSDGKTRSRAREQVWLGSPGAGSQSRASSRSSPAPVSWTEKPHVPRVRTRDRRRVGCLRAKGGQKSLEASRLRV